MQSSTSMPVVVLALTLMLCGCAEQRIRDASQSALNAGHFEQSVQILKDGRHAYPESEGLRTSLVLTQMAALTSLLDNANALINQGKIEQAGAQIDRALSIDPHYSRALELKALLDIERRQSAALMDAEALVAKGQPDAISAALKLVEQSLKDNPRHAGLLELQHRLLGGARQQQIRQASKTALAETRPISLDFRDASLRTVLDVVSRNSGINFILDKDIKPDARVTVLMKQAKVEDALDLIIGTNQLGKKVIDPLTIVIYPNTAEKQREYQEQVVRVFYLSNAEAKGAATFLKSMLKLRDPFVDERSNMLALRDSPDNIQLAERLITLYDASEPEVLLEVEVMEVSANKTTQAGISLPSSVGFSISSAQPIPGENSTGSITSGLNLANIRHLTRDQIAINVGGATATLNRQLGDFTTLANPRIRVKNREKAKVMVGEKIPVVSATTGQAGFVSDSVTYLDVGLKLDVEPTVYTNDEVGIKLGLEVSSLGAAVQTKGGTLAYQISTRNTSTVLRLHDNESQLLAGLISKDESHSSTGLPGLDALPLLGRLFSSKTDVNNKTELVLVITPHIVRNIRPADASETELWVGTEAQPRLRPISGLVNAAQGEAPAAKGSPSSPNAIASEAAARSAADGKTEEVAKPTALRWSVPKPVKPGEIIEVGLSQDTPAAMRGMTLELDYDHARLQLLDATEGDFFKQGGAITSFSRAGDEAQNSTLRIGILRNQATTATGSGNLLMLRFKAKASGSAEIKLVSARPITLSASAAPLAALPSVAVQVTP